MPDRTFPSRRVLIRGARVYSHEGNVHEPAHADVLVEDTVIAATGAEAATRVAMQPEGVQVVEAGGMLLVPGFFNAHYHSYDAFAKGMFEDLPLDIWRQYTGRMGAHRAREEVRLRTMLGAVECLRNGITTVQDMSILVPYDAQLVDVILDAYAEVGIRVVFSISIRDLPDAATIPYAREMLSPELQQMLGNRYDEAKDVIGFVSGLLGSRRGTAPLHWALSPSAPQRCSLPLLQMVADLASRHDLPVYTHLYEGKSHALFARLHHGDDGGSLVRYLDRAGLLGPRLSVAHGLWSRREELDLLASRGARVIVNVMSNFKLKDGVPPINEFRRAGLGMALGCDCSSCSDVQNLFQSMKLCCLLASAENPESGHLSAAQALYSATAGGAATAGLEQVLGDIKPGMKADLVLLDLADPSFVPFNSAARQLVFSETGRAVHSVMVDGRMVVRNRRVLTVDEAGLAAEIALRMPAYRAEFAQAIEAAEPLTRALQPLMRRINDQDVGIDRFS